MKKKQTKREDFVHRLHCLIDALGNDYVTQLENDNIRLKKEQKEAFRLIDKYIQIVGNKNKQLIKNGVEPDKPKFVYRAPYKPPKGYNKYGELL